MALKKIHFVAYFGGCDSLQELINKAHNNIYVSET
jgi:hypothetical protein